MKLSRGQLKVLINEVYSNSKRRLIAKQIDAAFYKLLTLLSKWQIEDDFLQNTTDDSVLEDVEDIHRRIARLSNEFDEIKQRTTF